MKNRLTFLWIFLLMAIGLQAQIQTLTVTGTITNISTLAPIPNNVVNISIDSANGFVYFNSVLTNDSGVYQDVITITPGTTSQGIVVVSAIDCNGAYHTQTQFFSTNTPIVVFDFQICGDTIPGDCQSSFDYFADSLSFSNTVHFYDQSIGDPIAWFWDFGDGAISTEQNPIYTYPNSGNYFVTLTITTANGCSSTSAKIVYVGGQPGGCQASFNYFNSNPAYPNQIQFTDQSFGNPQNWFWDFGDGTYSSEQNPNHTYLNAGLYNVCLSISSPDSSCNDMLCMPIFIGNPGGDCQANYSYLIEYIGDTMGGITGATVQFFDQSIGNINSWFWSFGDGTSSTEQNPVHVFMPNSAFMVCLTVQGDSSCTSTFCDTIFTGMQVDCQASFYYYPIGTPNQNINTFQFENTSTGSFTNVMWDFGDGNYSTEPSPIHTFTQGIWNVCLTISDQSPGGTCSDITCQTIIIDSTINCENGFSYQSTDLTVQFNGYMLGGDSATYLWDFGDPLYFGYGEGANVTHTYSAPGLYFVSLTTTTSSGCTFSSSKEVLVGDSMSIEIVQGTITAGNSYPESGIVLLLPATSLWVWNAQITTIDSMGHYFFDNVLPGSYHILAIPFSVNGDTMAYLPTYYGDVIFWEQATLVTLGTAAPAYNINLVACNGLILGPGNINGNITSTGLKAGMSDVNILLLDEQNQPLVFDKSSTSGGFDFSTLAYGSYTIWAEMHGVTTVPVKVTLSEENPTATVNLKLSGNSVMGIGDANSLVKSVGQVYPNPVSSNATLEIVTLKPVNFQTTLLDAMGRTIRLTSTNVNGSEQIQLNTQDLPNGVYTLLLTGDDGSRIQRKLIKTN